MRKLILTIILLLSISAVAETKFEARGTDYIVPPTMLLMQQNGVRTDYILHYGIGYYGTCLFQNFLEKHYHGKRWVKVVVPIIGMSVFTFMKENVDTEFDKKDIYYTGLGCGIATFSYTIKF